MKHAILAILTMNCLYACADSEKKPAKKVNYDDVSEAVTVDLNTVSGNITIIEDGTVSIEEIPQQVGKDCEVSQRKEGQALKVRSELPSWAAATGQRCVVDFVVHTKALSGLEMDVGDGDVRIAINNLLDGSVLKMDIGSGNVDFKAKSVRSGKFEADVGNGDITVRLPPDLAVTADLDTGSGKTHNDFGSEPGSRFHVNAETGSGSIRVLKE